MSRPAPPLPAFAQLETYVVESARLLLVSYDREIEPGESAEVDPAGPSVMSIIGFAGEGMRGSLLLLSPRDTVLALVPAPLRRSGPPLELVLRDLLGEFANMLAGRMKNRLLAHGVDLLVSTPTTVLGEELVVPPPASGASAWLRFTGSGALLLVRLEATFDPDFTLAPADEAKAPLVKEGEMILF